MSNYNDDILNHYGIEKTAGSVFDGSIWDLIGSHLYKCLHLLIANSKISTHRNAPYRPKKVGTLLYMISGSGVNKRDMVAEYVVSITWAGNKGQLDMQVETPDRGRKTTSFNFKGSDRIDDLAKKYAEILDALGGF